MIENGIRDKLLESTYLVKLVSGELLICVLIMNQNGTLSAFFPYEIHNDTEMITFCPMAKNRRFEISINGCIFIKSANSEISDEFFYTIITEESKDFEEFMEYYTQYLIVESEENLDEMGISIDDEVPKETVFH